mgnify:CR=1 FL=1
MKSLVDYITDYENASSATGNEKKSLASEYGTSNKIKDIQYAILLKMREERHTRKEFDTTDITKLMNATLITVGLLNTDNPQVNTILVLPPKFQLAILEYL